MIKLGRFFALFSLKKKGVAKIEKENFRLLLNVINLHGFYNKGHIKQFLRVWKCLSYSMD